MKTTEDKSKKEINKELTKAKKTVREKDKEIVKLKTEIIAFKKIDANVNNAKLESNNKEQQDQN